MTCIATNGRIPISEGLQAASGKGKFEPDNRNGCEKYNDSDDSEWFLGFDDKGNDLYMKHWKVYADHLVLPHKVLKKNRSGTSLSASFAT